MTWLTYLLGAHWPLLALIVTVLAAIILLTTDRRPRP